MSTSPFNPPIPEGCRQVRIEDVGATRLRVLLRDAGINPSEFTDREVLERYRNLFGSYCIINSERDQDDY